MTKTIIKSNQADTTQKFDKLIKENKQLSEKLKRCLADYQNFEKRVEAQRQVFISLAMASIFDKVLANLDDFYVVNQHLDNKGLKMALDKFELVLKSEGLEEIKAQGQTFNPQTMDCVDTTHEVKKDIIAKVKKKGYKFNGQVIRPAHVVVGTK